LVGEQHFKTRGHFFAVAAEAMRRILIDRARQKRCVKRGGRRARVDLDPEHVVAPERSDDLLSLDDALNRLAVHDQRKARLVVAAIKLFSDALEADPKLADNRTFQHRYNAACYAALAGFGKGNDESSPNEAARATLRKQALGWLKAELAVWVKLVKSGDASEKPMAVHALLHWKQDADLVGVRDTRELARLPEAERKEWRSLWADVEDALLNHYAGPRP
jgi:hypothetical protein